MLHSLQSNARRLAAETRGAEIAEAAAVLPLMFMMLLGIFWFGQAFSIYGAITRAAQEGARAGAVPICATCPVTNSFSIYSMLPTAVQAALVASKLDPSHQATPPVTLSLCPGRLAVACAAPAIRRDDQRKRAQMCNPQPCRRTIGSNGNGVCGTSVTVSIPVPVLAAFYLAEQTENLAYSVCPGTDGDARDSCSPIFETCLLRRRPAGATTKPRS